MTHDEARILLEAIQDSKYHPNKWEADFLSSIEAYVEDGRKITPKQSETIQGVYRKAYDR